MNSFYDKKHCLQHGDIKEGFARSDHILEGEVSIGGQEHFYMETNGSLVIPRREHSEYEVWVSGQGLAGIQVFLCVVSVILFFSS